MRWLFASWLLALIVTSFQIRPVSAATELELDENESMIVELRLGSYMLTGATIVYHSNDYTVLSFQEFLDALDFAITVDSETQQASGWFIKPQNTFSLNIKSGEVYIRGQKQVLAPDFLFYADEFDLYLDLEDLERWFDLDIQLQMARLIVKISSEESLPIEQRVMREKMRSKNAPKPGHKLHPWVNDKYAWLGPPALDVRLNAVKQEPDEEAQWGYSVQSTSDVLKHQARISHIQIDQTTPSSTRLTLAKKALRPGTSLGLGLTRYELGDIYARGDSLVSQGAPGVGATFERYLSAALDQSFNRRDFEGDAPPGWEIELSRNGLFVDFQVVDESGRYIFKDVEVQYGENFFEITRYGPQGQVEIERKRVQIGEEMITPGDWQFSATFLNDHDQLIGESILADAQSAGANKPQSIAATALYGFREQHSLGLGFNRLPSPGKDNESDFARLILISAYPLFSTRVDYAQDLNAGRAASINLSGRLFKQDINIENIYFEEFFSAQSNYGNIKQKHKISLFGSIQAFKVRQLPYSLGLNMIDTVDGTRRLTLENRLSLFVARNRFSNELVFSTNSRADSYVPTRGVFTFGRSSGSLQFRTGFAYTLNPGALTSGSMTMDYRRADWHVQLSTAAAKTELQGETYNLGLNLSKTFGNLAVGLSSATDFRDVRSFAVTFDMGLKGHAHTPYVNTAQYGSSAMGTLKARVFMDANGNGAFDPHEEPLENVRFKGRSSWQQRATDKSGVVVLSGMDTALGSVVTLDTISLNDPYLQPTLTSFRLASHAGAYQTVDIPVTEITEVEGYVLLVKGENEKPVSGVTVGLYREGMEIVRTTTEFDGYYLFPYVPPGVYTVTLVDDDSGMEQYRWSATEPFETDIESGITTVPVIQVEEKE